MADALLVDVVVANFNADIHLENARGGSRSLPPQRVAPRDSMPIRLRRQLDVGITCAKCSEAAPILAAKIAICSSWSTRSRRITILIPNGSFDM